MKHPSIIASIVLSLSFGLMLPRESMSLSITSGNLSSIGMPGPENIALDLMFLGTDATFSSVSAYYAAEHHCPPANFFLKQPNSGMDMINSIYNDANCGVVGHFSSKAPGALQNQYIRLVPKQDSSGVFDFTFRQTITNIDFDPNGKNPSFLNSPLQKYRWSPTLQGSSYGNVPIATLSHVLNDTYAMITQQNTAANSSTSSSSSSGSTYNTNIVSV